MALTQQHQVLTIWGFIAVLECRLLEGRDRALPGTGKYLVHLDTVVPNPVSYVE